MAGRIVTRYLAIGAAAVFVLGGLLGFITWQNSHIKKQAGIIAEQDRHIGVVESANAGLAEALATMEEGRNRDNALIEASAQETDKFAAEARTLERRLREALRHATILNLDAPLPADAALALCLRYRAARGLGVESAERSAAGGPDAGKDHSAASFCAAWRRVTLRDALEWVGLLLDHAGAERIDKAALRQWAQPLPQTEGPAMGKGN